MFTFDWLDPYTMIYIGGLMLALSCTQIKDRREMMFVKFMSDYTNAAYTFMMGGLAGALGGLIAGTGGLVQSLTPDKHLQKTLWPRIIGACILSAASIYFSYKNPIDILPMVAIIGCRFMELHHDAEKIRMAYFVAGGLWITYFIVEHIPMMAFTSGLMSAMLLLGIIRHRAKREIVDPV